jgi:hypothetical protein
LTETTSRWVRLKRYQRSPPVKHPLSFVEPVVSPEIVVRPELSVSGVAPAQVSLLVEQPSSMLPLQLSSQLLPQTSAAAQQVVREQTPEQLWEPAVPQDVVQACVEPAQQL